MVDLHLFDNQTGPIGVSINGPTTTFEIGTCFHVDTAAALTQLRWYRVSAGSPAPSALRLWDTTTQTVVYTATSVPDNGSVGWQTHQPGASPMNLVANREYRVSISTPNNFQIANFGSSPAIVPSSPLHFESNVRCYRLNSFLYPNSQDGAIYHLVDIGVGASVDEAPPEAPVTNESLDARLQAWLDKDSADFPDSTPILTYEAVTDATDGLPAILTAVNGIATDMLQADSAVITELRNAVDTVEPVLVAALGAGGAMLTGALRTYLDGMQASIDNSLQYSLQAQGGTQGVAGHTDPGWTVVDSGAFAGTFEVLDRCDRVYVHITTVGASVTTYQENGRDLGSFAWWWAPTFANMLGRYHTSRAREAVLYEPGMRMDGALVVLPPDFEGTYEASRFDG